MPTLADSLVSSSSRKLTMRLRPDLVFDQHRYQGRVSWVVKDPVGLKYFRFHDGEYFLLRQLDGNSSLDEIKARFEKQYPPEKISLEELQQFIGTLHRGGLILADVVGQGTQLKKRKDERRRQELLEKFSNILAIRFRGIDPDRILEFLLPYVRWMFQPLGVIACCTLILSALVLLAVQFEEFQSRLPVFRQFFTVDNAVLLAVALGCTKIIHEFGHGLSCKYYGGECHEMGLMFLVLTPCLYCNVSDSWMLPNKWHRVIIGAAGMYVELILASICTFIWWFSEPGILNYLCLSTMFVSSVSTIMFNGNPLLRYDGYYILSDILEIPNLRQKSSDILQRKLSWWCLGLESPDDPFLPQRNQTLFALYTVASAVYRWVVLYSILWFTYTVFQPYRLQVVGIFFLLLASVGLVAVPIYKVGKFFYVPGRIDKVKKPRMYASLTLLGLVLGALLVVPLPYRILCLVQIKPYQPEPVYVEVAGQLVSLHVQPGDVVHVGQVLAELRDLNLEMTIAELQGQRDQLKAQYESLQRERFRDAKAGAQVAQTKESLEAIERQLTQKQGDLKRLTLTAPRAGTVMAPQEVEKQTTGDGTLKKWHGTPLKTFNLGCYLETSTLFCQIGNPQQMEASLVVDQADIEFIRREQEVDIQLDQMTGEELHGKLVDIARSDMKVAPKGLSNKSGGELATITDASGVERPMSVSYQCSVPLDNADGMLRIGLTGRAKVHVGSRTVAQRVWRLLTQTFHFKL